MFFGSRNCYLLVFDCSHSVECIVEKNRLVYWIYFLQSHLKEKNIPIYLIGTKYDKLENKMKEEKLQKRLKQINKGKTIFLIFFSIFIF